MKIDQGMVGQSGVLVDGKSRAGPDSLHSGGFGLDRLSGSPPLSGAGRPGAFQTGERSREATTVAMGDFRGNSK